MKQPTIYDVAKEAGVAISTVSKVLNNTGKISENTKRKVEETMQKLNYRPSIVSSVKKRLKTIGFLIPNIADPFMAEIAKIIEDHGRKYGYTLMVCSTDNNLEKEAAYISILRRKYIDGIVIATGLNNEGALKELRESRIPFVILSRDVPSENRPTVLVDDYVGASKAVNYLVGIGHKKIGVITENDYFYATIERLKGYKDVLEKSNIEYKSEYVSVDNTSYIDAKESAILLLKLKSPPTAIFASTEPLAIGAMQGVRECGLNIPDDVSVIGFDNSILSEMCHPQLTTISQPIEEMGKKVIELLVDEIEKEKNTLTKSVVMASELIIRGSTKKV